MKRPTGIRAWLVLGLLVLSIGGKWLGDYVGGNMGEWYQLIALLAGVLLALLVLARLIRKSWQELQKLQDQPNPDTEDESAPTAENSTEPTE